MYIAIEWLSTVIVAVFHQHVLSLYLAFFIVHLQEMGSKLIFFVHFYGNRVISTDIFSHLFSQYEVHIMNNKHKVLFKISNLCQKFFSIYHKIKSELFYLGVFLFTSGSFALVFCAFVGSLFAFSLKATAEWLLRLNFFDDF